MSLQSRLSSMFSRRRLDSDLDDELRSHIEMRTEELISSGMAPEGGGRLWQSQLS